MDKQTSLPLTLRALRKLRLSKKLGLLEALYGQSLARSGVCWVHCANGINWKLNLNDSCHRWIVYGKYEGGAGIEFARSRLVKGGIYVDSGANIGQWLLYLGGIKNLKTLAFEPVTSQRQWLQSCLEEQANWDVKVFDLGLGAISGERDIQVDGARSTLCSDWYQDQNLATEKIRIGCLSDVLDANDIDTIDFWKLDVEGAELEALKGAKRHLERQRIKCIYFECHPSNYKSVTALLLSKDYALFDLVGGRLHQKRVEEITETQDIVALPAR